MKLYGVIGWKDSGKTSLMERLVSEITRRGLTVSTVKHVHHDVDLDQPGKDTHRHRQAGAREVVLAAPNRFALMSEHRGPEPDLTTLLSRMAPVDLILVEGYKRDSHPKLEVWRRDTGHDLIQPQDPLVRAVATDEPIALPVPVLDLNDTAAIADFILSETGLVPHRFDTVAIVDWSATSGPSPARESADAIWIGTATAQGTEARYFRTRADAESHLSHLIDSERAVGRRLLLGFDFAFGYPQGFAARLTGTANPRALWRWLADRITDEANANNRFDVADSINRHFAARGPLWGCPRGRGYPNLPETREVTASALGLPDHRRTDAATRAQPVWKLFTTGAVGSQSLMGLPMIHRLSCRHGTAVWPFDPVTAAPTVLAEVYPSLLAPLVARTDGIKDRAQVTLLARALLRLSRENRLAPLFTTPADPAILEEGWVLGASHADTLLAAAEGP